MFVERYGTSIENAVVWGRRVALIWAGLEADFELAGETRVLEDRVTSFLEAPDHAMYWDTGATQLSSQPFRAYVQRLRDRMR